MCSRPRDHESGLSMPRIWDGTPSAFGTRPAACYLVLDSTLSAYRRLHCKAEAEKVSVFLRLSSHDFPVKRSGGETDIHMQGIAPTPLHTCRHSAYPLPHSAQVFFKKSEWARGGRGVGKRKVGRGGRFSRFSRWISFALGRVG